MDAFRNNSSRDRSYDYGDYGDIFFNYSDHSNTFFQQELFFMQIVVPCFICIALPLTLWAIYASCSQVQKDHVAPIYVINLLISDLIQLCCMIVWVVPDVHRNTVFYSTFIYDYSLAVSVCFMMCVGLERYLVIVRPLWYRFKRTIKVPAVVCVLAWVLPLVCFSLFHVLDYTDSCSIIQGVFLLLPLPLFIFFLVGTLRALSASRLPSDEKRRIVGTLVLVLLIYMLLFLPKIIYFLVGSRTYSIDMLTSLPLLLSPLADSLLYVFMRKGMIDKLLASVCCCRMDSNDSSTSSSFTVSFM